MKERLGDEREGATELNNGVSYGKNYGASGRQALFKLELDVKKRSYISGPQRVVGSHRDEG